MSHERATPRVGRSAGRLHTLVHIVIGLHGVPIGQLELRLLGQ